MALAVAVARALPLRLWLAVWGTLVVFVLAVAASAYSLVRQQETEAVQEANRRVEQFAASAAASLNRSLLGIDLLLAGMDELLLMSLTADGVDAQRAGQLLRGLRERNLELQSVALHGADDAVLAHGASAAAPQLADPALLAMARADRPARLRVAAADSPHPGEPTLRLARASTRWPGLVAVAESSLHAMVPPLTADGDGLVVTLEHAGGAVLASQPAGLAAAGLWPLGASQRTGAAFEGGHRITGQAALLAARPAINTDLVLVVSLPLQEALAPWRLARRSTWLVALAFMALASMVAVAAHVHLARLHEARRALAQSAATLDQALASMAEAFLLCDADDRLVRWNGRYLELFPHLRGVVGVGVPYRRLAEAAARLLLPDGDEAAHAAWIEARLALHRSGNRVWEQELGDGRVVNAIERLMPDGGVVGVYRDITAAERRLAQAKTAAEAANAAKTRFLATMSHEIRTPLNALLGFTGLLRQSPLNPQQQRWVELMGTAGDALLGMISDVLDMSRIEAGRLSLDAQPFDPTRLLQDAVSLMSERAAARGLRLVLDMPRPLPPLLLGDAARLGQILFNLLGNALKFTEQGQVVVRARAPTRPDGRFDFDVEVEDSGPGIPEAMREAVFDRFVQGGPRPLGGSGLGLAICRELLALMGGQIEARPAPTGGALLHLCVPLAAAAPGDLPSVDQDSLTSSVAVAPLDILVAEDNTVNQVLVKAMLDCQGHRSVIVGNGQEALDRVAQQPFDLVLMDVQMPMMDGLEATRRIRALPGPAGRLPIVAMTANALADDRQLCLDAGMDDYLTKPLDLQALERMISRVAIPARPAPPGSRREQGR